ncbi:MAG TPA: 3'(2'),5'-bisphosphate nucleotidase [Bacteroidetes bacterium]|nr:3'(2'),5'-bisphosphate nucleotidase [Bacteroidota bacterium]
MIAVTPGLFADSALPAAVVAGEEIMRVLAEPGLQVREKADLSPVTEADMRAHRVITSKLMDTGIPVLSEEGRDIPYEERRKWEYYWLVDPLDGTREFIDGTGEFTVNIALIGGGDPLFGVIYVPVRREMFFTGTDGKLFSLRIPEGCLDAGEMERLAAEVKPQEQKPGSPLRVVASRSHLNEETRAFIGLLKKEHPDLLTVSRGSSLKFCMMARGEADLYPRLGKTMEWDTAAGQAIARAAGCRVLRMADHRPLRYNKPSLENPWFVVIPPPL